MKNLIRQTIGLPSNKRCLAAAAVVTVAAVLAFAIPAEKAQADSFDNGNRFTLAGSWVSEVGSQVGQTFTAFETFTEAGSSIETNNGPGSGPLAPGIGTWVRSGPRTFLATFWRQRFEANGSYAGNMRIRRAITLNQNNNELTGRDNVDLFDASGNRLPIDIPSSTFHGMRIVAQPLTW